MAELVIAWQEWWNLYGFEWYKNGDPYKAAPGTSSGPYHQDERPPFLVSGHPLYGKRVVRDGSNYKILGGTHGEREV